jgi:hypothetical protein
MGLGQKGTHEARGRRLHLDRGGAEVVEGLGLSPKHEGSRTEPPLEAGGRLAGDASGLRRLSSVVAKGSTTRRWRTEAGELVVGE